MFEGLRWNGLNVQGVLDQAAEKLPSASRGSAIQPQGELIEIMARCSGLVIAHPGFGGLGTREHRAASEAGGETAKALRPRSTPILTTEQMAA